MNKPFAQSSARSSLVAFETPTNIAEARNRMSNLFSEIKLIEAQMKDPNRTNRSGERMSGKEYTQWKRGANYALASKQAEYNFLKTWISNQREQRELDLMDHVGDDADLVAELVEGFELVLANYPEVAVPPKVQAALDASRALIQRRQQFKQTVREMAEA